MKQNASPCTSLRRRRDTGAIDSFYSFKVSHPHTDKARLYLAYEMWQHDSPWQCGCGLLLYLLFCAHWCLKKRNNQNKTQTRVSCISTKKTNSSSQTPHLSKWGTASQSTPAQQPCTVLIQSQSHRNSHRGVPLVKEGDALAGAEMSNSSVPPSPPEPLPLGQARGVLVVKCFYQRYFPCLRGGWCNSEQLFQLL